MNNDYSAILSKLDVFILSRNRKNSLQQVINFWSQTPCKIHVFHETDHALSIPTHIDNIKYWPSKENLFARMAKIQHHITSPYSVLANDDEIYLPEALSKIIQELDNNAEIGSIGGQVVSYTWVGKILLGLPLYKGLIGYSNLANSSVSRISKTFYNKNFMDLLSVHRSHIFLRIINNCSKFSNFSTPYMFEVMFSFFSSLNSKSTRINQLYWARNWHQKYQNDNFDWNRSLTWSEWYTNQKYLSERKIWCNTLSDLLLSEYHEIFQADNINFVINNIFNLLVVQNSATSKYRIPKISFLNNEKKWIIQNKIPYLKNRIIPRFEKSLAEMFKMSVDCNQKDLDTLFHFINEQKGLNNFP
jgi:hypothetical protein